MKLKKKCMLVIVEPLMEVKNMLYEEYPEYEMITNSHYEDIAR